MNFVIPVRLKFVFTFLLPLFLFAICIFQSFLQANYFFLKPTITTFEYVLMIFGLYGIFFVVSKIKKLENIRWLALAVSIIFIAITGYFISLVGVVVWVLASFLLGNVLLDRCSPLECLIERVAYAFASGLTINSYLVWAAIHFKVNFAQSYYLFFIVEILIFGFLSCWRKPSILIKRPFRAPSNAQYVLFFFMFLHLIYALVPNHCWDELVAHYYIPKVIARDAVFHFTPNYVPIFFNLAFVSIGANVTTYLLGGGDFAIRIFYWLIFYISFFIFESFVREKHGERISFFSTLVLVTTPYFLWSIGVPHIDGLALFSAIVVCMSAHSLFFEGITSKKIVLFCVLSCVGLFCKLQIIFLLIPFYLFLFIKLLRKDRTKLKVFMIGLVGVVVFFLPIFVHNWVITKNPIFPMYNNLIKSPFYEIKKPIPGFARFATVKLNLKSLYHITFQGRDYYVAGEEQNRFLFGISYFIFFPVSLFFLFFLNKIYKWYFVLFMMSVVLLYGITGAQMRYFISTAPIGAVLLGWVMSELLSIYEKERWKTLTFYFLFLSVFVANTIYQLSNSYLPSPLPIREALTKRYENSPLLNYKNNIRSFFKDINKMYPPSTKGLMYYSPAMYFCDFNVEVLDWYNQYTVMDIMRKPYTIDELYKRVFIDHKFDLLIITDQRPQKFLDDFITNGWVKKGFSSAGFSVYLPVKNLEKVGGTSQKNNAI